MSIVEILVANAVLSISIVGLFSLSGISAKVNSTVDQDVSFTSLVSLVKGVFQNPVQCTYNVKRIFPATLIPSQVNTPIVLGGSLVGFNEKSGTSTIILELGKTFEDIAQTALSFTLKSSIPSGIGSVVGSLDLRAQRQQSTAARNSLGSIDLGAALPISLLVENNSGVLTVLGCTYNVCYSKLISCGGSDCQVKCDRNPNEIAVGGGADCGMGDGGLRMSSSGAAAYNDPSSWYVGCSSMSRAFLPPFGQLWTSGRTPNNAWAYCCR